MILETEPGNAATPLNPLRYTAERRWERRLYRAVPAAQRLVRGGIYAARLWWILNYYGHPNVALLDGGWTKWQLEGAPASTPSYSSGQFCTCVMPMCPPPEKPSQ